MKQIILTLALLLGISAYGQTDREIYNHINHLLQQELITVEQAQKLWIIHKNK